VRIDGRLPNDLRPVRLVPDFTDNPLASVLCEVGRTVVLCTVSEEASVPRFLRGTGRGWLTAEYSLLRAVADLSALGERTLWVDCDVLQADGGTRCASITGAYVAVAVAVDRLVARGDLERNPLRDSVAAVSVGVIGGSVMLDLAYEEDARAEVDMNVVATGAGRFVEVQGTGEEGTFSVDELNQLTALGLQGIADLGALQQRAIAGARRTQ